jgi:hypothetical protein
VQELCVESSSLNFQGSNLLNGRRVMMMMMVQGWCWRGVGKVTQAAGT